MASRGHHLLTAGRGFSAGLGLGGRLAAPMFARLINRLDSRLQHGGIHARLPDGELRQIGFHQPGPAPEVELVSWMALVRLALSGSVGWYEAWALGEWRSPDPVPLFELFTRNALSLGETARAKGPARWLGRIGHALRDNRPTQARRNIAAHYDLGNDFYAAWLDPTMTYSSALFSPAERGSDGVSLEQAQRNKIDALLNRLDLKPGDRLLEIGCGWGSLAIEAARRGARVVGLTLSTQQKEWADRKVAEAGLSDQVEIRLQDYRQIDERFDAIASVEMVEAVGRRWWPAYFDCIARNLKPGGRAALQYIHIDHRLFAAYSRGADFIQAYIFPGGMLVDEPAFQSLAEQRGLGWSDRRRFGRDYAQTLRLWRGRYDSAVAEGRLVGFDEAFHNLWRYYLMYCEGGFRGGAIDVAQVSLMKGSKHG